MDSYCDKRSGRCVSQDEAMDIARTTGRLLTAYRDEDLCKQNCRRFSLQNQDNAMESSNSTAIAIAIIIAILFLSSL